MRNSIESLFARGISIVAKFLLLGYLAKKLSLDDYGSFQLISYFVLISTTIFGLEFYNVTNRRIAQETDKEQIYRQHFSFFATIAPYVVFLQIVLFLAVFPKELISITNVLLVLMIGLCDYFSQEVYRYLMINKSFRKGNLQLIYKSLLFILLIVVYDIAFHRIDFSRVLWIMLISYAILFLLAYKTFTSTLFQLGRGIYKKMTCAQFRTSLKAVWPFVLLVFCLKGIEFFDKFLIGKQLGLEEIGIFSFLFSIASVVHIFIVSGFYIVYLPQLIHSFSTEINAFKTGISKFGALTLVSSVFLALFVFMVSPYVFEIIGKPDFASQMDLLYIFLIGFIFNNLSLIPHLFLYVCHDEKAITLIMAISFISNLVLNLILIPKFGLVGAAYGFMLTYFIVLLLKLIRAQYKWKRIGV